jgi:putative acetyltransferase
MFLIRSIAERDDLTVAAIIRSVMPSFGAVGDGFAINDAEVDTMTRAYQEPRSAYFVVELDGVVKGGGGIAPLLGGPYSTCELRKMYFLPELRGVGAGRALMERCLATAKTFGFTDCYLETLSSMKQAQNLYERSGFSRIAQAMGKTGHGGCNTFYLRSL